VAEKGNLKATSADEGPSGPACPVAFCPVCAIVSALGEVRPEVTEHLLAAARETLQAVRSLLDARLDGTEPHEDRGRVQRIEIA
jgi:hypothetical protein